MITRKYKDPSDDIDVSWIIRRSQLPGYKKLLPGALEPEEYADRLKLYFNSNKKYNVYTLATALGVSKHRFETLYKNSPDPLIKEMTAIALDMIAGHALTNEEEYARSLKYILSYAETSKQFIELSAEAHDITQNKIIQLPQKLFDNK